MAEILRNEAASLSVDLFGGAITDFHLVKSQINPLKFAFTPEQMPENNKSGAPYQGHFLCLGRWGEPSEGEIKAGMPNHGHFANMLWKKNGREKKLILEMNAESEMEGLSVQRRIRLEERNPVYLVEETVANINSIGRPYNIVQHPTVAFPFLDDQTLVDCNGDRGFNQKFYQSPEKYESQWPLGLYEEASFLNIRNPRKGCNAIFSYVIKSNDELGWVTCYSPKFKTLIGYVWKRGDFPWVHFWLDWKDDKLRYRGLEFGTAGIHQPFRNILKTPTIFNENTLVYIDAGEKVKFSYQSFITEVEDDFDGVDKVEIKEGRISIQSRNGRHKIDLPTVPNTSV